MMSRQRQSRLSRNQRKPRQRAIVTAADNSGSDRGHSPSSLPPPVSPNSTSTITPSLVGQTSLSAPPPENGIAPAPPPAWPSLAVDALYRPSFPAAQISSDSTPWLAPFAYGQDHKVVARSSPDIHRASSPEPLAGVDETEAEAEDLAVSMVAVLGSNPPSRQSTMDHPMSGDNRPAVRIDAHTWRSEEVYNMAHPGEREETYYANILASLEVGGSGTTGSRYPASIRDEDLVSD